MDIYTEVINSMVSELTVLVEKAGIAVAAVISIGIVIFGVKYLVKTIKDFFATLTGSGDYGGEYADSWEYIESGQRDADFDYDIDS